MPLDTETMGQLRDTVRRFVRERLIPNERKVEESDAIPPDILAEMRELGLFGLTIPEEYGGLGLNTEEEMQIIYEVAHASPAYRSCFASTIGIGSQGIVIDGTPEQRAEISAAHGQGRTDRLLRPDRAGRRLRRRASANCRRAATATISCSTAPSASSPMRRKPASSR